MGQSKLLERVQEEKIISIIRGIPTGAIQPVVQSLYEGGIRMVEITFDQKSSTKLQDTGNAIKEAVKLFGDKIMVGAGTVMSVEEVETANEAGASFLLSPNVNKTIIQRGAELGMGIIPGAMTPTEVLDAYEAGADIVKLFPAGELGAAYCKAIMAPINHVPMVAVGGINEKNIQEFLNISFAGVGIGANIVGKKLVDQEDWTTIKETARRYVKLTRPYKKQEGELSCKTLI